MVSVFNMESASRRPANAAVAPIAWHDPHTSSARRAHVQRTRRMSIWTNAPVVLGAYGTQWSNRGKVEAQGCVPRDKSPSLGTLRGVPRDDTSRP